MFRKKEIQLLQVQEHYVFVSEFIYLWRLFEYNTLSHFLLFCQRKIYNVNFLFFFISGCRNVSECTIKLNSQNTVFISLNLFLEFY